MPDKNDALNRTQLARAFAKKNGLNPLSFDALKQDASFRRYFRVKCEDSSYILMDAPPENENVTSFMAIDHHLQSIGQRVPTIHAYDTEQGFLLLEDLGHNTFTTLLNQHPDQEQALYERALQCLIAIYNHPQATDIDLPSYDEAVFMRETQLLCDWYYPHVKGSATTEQALQDYNKAWRTIYDDLPALKPGLVLRDFHVDNLMIVDGAQCALLDFQDALIGTPCYDLLSLFEDARRDISPDIIDHSVQQFKQQCIAQDEYKEFDHHYAVWAAQRHSKVLGIFCRLYKRDGKDIYLQHLDRVKRLFNQHIEHPALLPLKKWCQVYFNDLLLSKK